MKRPFRVPFRTNHVRSPISPASPALCSLLPLPHGQSVFQRLSIMDALANMYRAYPACVDAECYRV